MSKISTPSNNSSFIDAFRESTRVKRHRALNEEELSGKILCPHCGMLKGPDEMDENETHIRKLRLGLGPWFMPNWYKISYENSSDSI